MTRLYRLINVLGPGIMAIGFTIGTGSVTSMIVAGNRYGMQLLWVLALSCLFSWLLMEAYGRYALVTGETALYGFRKHLRYGKAMAILIIIGITIGQWNSLIGILGISANVLFETLVIFFPILEAHAYLVVLTIASLILALMYGILMQGKYSSLEKILVFFVSLMALSFVISLFVAFPQPSEIGAGMLPSIPEVPGGKLLVAAFVGTTMAAATFLSRPLFVKGKKWTIEHLPEQRRDAITAAILIFLISGAIMAIATATLHASGTRVVKVFDMMQALQPLAGKFAVAIFFVGILGAGLSSVFPILMITPILIADYRAGELDITSRQFRTITGLACIVGMTVPVFGFNPINAQILTQVFNVFVLPLVIIGIIILLNNRGLMGEHRASLPMNIGMALSLVFACVVSYTGVLGIFGMS